MTDYLCQYYQTRRVIDAESMIEAIMEFYREEEVFPEEVRIHDEDSGTRIYEGRVEALQNLLEKRTKERDLAIQGIQDVYHATKEALRRE